MKSASFVSKALTFQSYSLHTNTYVEKIARIFYFLIAYKNWINVPMG